MAFSFFVAMVLTPWLMVKLGASHAAPTCGEASSSSAAATVESSVVTMITGISEGIVTFQNRCQALAPSTIAAS